MLSGLPARPAKSMHTSNSSFISFVLTFGYNFPLHPTGPAINQDEFVRMYAELATRNSSAKNLMLEEIGFGAVGREHIEAAKFLHQKRNELTRLQSEIGNLEKELTMAECKPQHDDDISKLSSKDEDYDNISLAGLKFVDSNVSSTRSKVKCQKNENDKKYMRLRTT